MEMETQPVFWESWRSLGRATRPGFSDACVDTESEAQISQQFRPVLVPFPQPASANVSHGVQLCDAPFRPELSPVKAVTYSLPREFHLSLSNDWDSVIWFYHFIFNVQFFFFKDKCAFLFIWSLLNSDFVRRVEGWLFDMSHWFCPNRHRDATQIIARWCLRESDGFGGGVPWLVSLNVCNAFSVLSCFTA